MAEIRFMMEGFTVRELSTGLELQMIEDNCDAAPGAWISGWFILPNGHLVIQQFQVIKSCLQTYERSQGALVYWGKAVLDAELTSIEASPEFARSYIYESVAWLAFNFN